MQMQNGKDESETGVVKPNSDSNEFKDQSPDTDIIMEDASNNDSNKENEMKEETETETEDNNNNNTNSKSNDKSEKESESDDDSSSSDDDEDDDMFAGLTKKEKRLMKERMAEVQNGYAQNEMKEENHEINIIINAFKTIDEEISIEEAKFINNFGKQNKISPLDQIETDGAFFLLSMREMLNQKGEFADDDSNNNNDYESSSSDDDNDDDDDSDSDEEYDPNGDKRKVNRKRRNTNKNSNSNSNSNSNNCTEKGKNKDGSIRCGRLLLKDALKSKDSFEGWSEARKKAWNEREKNTNSYYYRFNDPGEEQRGKAWTDDEHKCFMMRVMEVGVNVEWGNFSRKISGRVGYQCSNYWRNLVSNGLVSDPNYSFEDVTDEKTGKTKTKLKFLRKDASGKNITDEFRRYAFTIIEDRSNVFKPNTQHPKAPKNIEDIVNSNGGNGDNSNSNSNKNKRGKKRKREEDDNKDLPSNKRRKKNKKKKNDDDDDVYFANVEEDNLIPIDDNPLPNMIDCMTGMTIVKPAISPYGHVLGYDTWCKILRNPKTKDTCPFTKKHLTRRSLIKLDKDNIGNFKIINISQEEAQQLQ